jgi:hypothetical protein
MRSINVGGLVHQVLIQQRDTVPVDASGAPTNGDWTTLQVAAMGRDDRRRSDRGGESFTGDQLSALMTTRWTMRYLREMDPDFYDVQKTRRLVYNGRAHDIVDVEVMDRQVGLVIRTIASSRVAA